MATEDMMPSVEAVEEALIQAGEWRASRHIGGFRARTHAIDVVVIRWQPPVERPDLGDAIAYVEDYARILRRAGISATVILDASGPRVLCLPERVEHYRPPQSEPQAPAHALRAANT
jgi:hypothetical protein